LLPASRKVQRAATRRVKRAAPAIGQFAALLFLVPASAAADAWSDALSARDLVRIDQLLDEPRSDPNRPDAEGKTALMFAAQDGKIELVARLIARGADVNAANANGGTPLMYAALGGDAVITRLILEYGGKPDHKANLGWTALEVAAVKGHAAVASVLLRAGADPNVRDAYGWTPLMRAADLRRIDVVRTLLDTPGTSLSARQESGRTALHIASAAGDPDIVALLIERGADATLVDYQGHTPASLAELAGHMDIVEFLQAASQSTSSNEQ
jgi:ankyrin repeat protein